MLAIPRQSNNRSMRSIPVVPVRFADECFVCAVPQQIGRRLGLCLKEKCFYYCWQLVTMLNTPWGFADLQFHFLPKMRCVNFFPGGAPGPRKWPWCYTFCTILLQDRRVFPRRSDHRLGRRIFPRRSDHRIWRPCSLLNIRRPSSHHQKKKMLQTCPHTALRGRES